MLKFGVITSFLGETKDRFHVYNKPATLEEKLRMAAEIPGYEGVELVHPYEVSDPQETRTLLARYGLSIAALNVNVKAEPEFINGGLTSPQKAVREKAVAFIKAAKDFAAEVSAPHVTCCPLADGFEFAFDADYRQTWRRLVEGFGEAGGYRPEIPLYIEYKPKETRARCFLGTAAKTVCLLKDIGVKSMGVTLDYGHSIYAGEQPAEALTLVADSGFGLYVHVNDNDGTWDWDLFCGSHTLLSYIEFLYYVREVGYDKFITSDTHPTRWDMKEMFAINARVTGKIWDRLAKVDGDELKRLMTERDYMKTWRFVEKELLAL